MDVFFDSDDGGSDVASDIAEKERAETESPVIPDGDGELEFGLDDLEVRGMDRTTKPDDAGDAEEDDEEGHSSLFDSLTYYYNYFLPHLRMPNLQIPEVISNFKPFSALPQLKPLSIEVAPAVMEGFEEEQTAPSIGGADSAVDGQAQSSPAKEDIAITALPDKVPEPIGIVLILPG